MQCMTGTCEYPDEQVDSQTTSIYEYIGEEESPIVTWIRDHSDTITIGNY